MKVSKQQRKNSNIYGMKKSFFEGYKRKYLEVKEYFKGDENVKKEALKQRVEVETLAGELAKGLMGQQFLHNFIEQGKCNSKALIKDLNNISCKLFQTSNDFFRENREFIISNHLIDFFNGYNYTLKEEETFINEDSKEKVAITPEMLGIIFESLLDEEERRGKGVFYTPKNIVHYMCRETLINIIVERVKLPYGAIRDFITYEENQKVKIENVIIENLEAIDEVLKSLKIIEPSVGSGAFLVGMLNVIVGVRNNITHLSLNKNMEAKRLNNSRTIYNLKLETIKNNLFGIDIDPAAVEITKLRLCLSLLTEEEKIITDNGVDYLLLSSLERNIIVGNSLIKKLEGQGCESQNPQMGEQISIFQKSVETSSSTIEKEISFESIFKEQGGFDIIIGNPPYVGEKGNKEIFREISNTPFGKKYYQGKMDLFYFFFHKALDIGRENAIIAFITTNYYPTANGAYTLREDLKNRGNILKLINFNELRIFDSATGQHNLITIIRKNKESHRPTAIINVQRKGTANPTMLNQILYGRDEETTYSRLNHEDLFKGNQFYIRMEEGEDPILQGILDKIAKGKKLEELCHVNQGIVSGADKLTNKHIEKYNIKGEKGEGIFVVTQEEIEGINPSEKELTLFKHFFKNSDIFRYYTNSETHRQIIYIDRNLKEIGTLYPNVKEHLKKYYPILAERREVKNGTIEFFHLQWNRKEAIFRGEKIIAPQRSKLNTFAYNNAPWYSSADVYYITKKDSKINLKYILGILNSKLYYLWFYHRGKRKGEIFELYQTPLKESPILVDETLQEDLINLVDEIIICKDKQRERELQSRIDHMVYKIYALEKDEIEAIEVFVESKGVELTPSVKKQESI